MASPPFDINAAIPEDDDIVSQHPSNARLFRDIVESWLLVEHNVQGRHAQVSLDHQTDPAGTTAVSRLWASITGNMAGILRWRNGTGNVEFVGPPPGTGMDFWGTTAPEGYIFANGQAISRTTFARLFDVFGTTYGSGDGSTTFNVPDKRGRVSAGKDDMGGSSANRLTSPINGDNLGAVGGLESHTLITAEMPAHGHTGTTSTDGLHQHSYEKPNADGGSEAGPFQRYTPSTVNTSTDGNHNHSLNLNNTGGGGAHNNMQPTIVANYIIKT